MNRPGGVIRPDLIAAGAINKQSGVVLFIALIMLVAMTMAGLALMRGIGSGLGITSNLSFKQIATAQTDFGIENARTWLITQGRRYPRRRRRPSGPGMPGFRRCRRCTTCSAPGA